MKAIELVRWSMQMTDEGVAAIVKGMREHAMTPSNPGGNHAMWNLGHICFIEGAFPSLMIGEANPVQHWAPLFDTGSKPSSDGSKYPPFEEVLKKFHELRARNLKILEEIGDAGLDRAPKVVPPPFEEAMKTIGRAYITLALHTMVHYGEIADARRVVGLKPLM